MVSRVGGRLDMVSGGVTQKGDDVGKEDRNVPGGIDNGRRREDAEGRPRMR